MYKNFYAQGNNLGEVLKSSRYLNVIAGNKTFLKDLATVELNPIYIKALEYKDYINTLRNLGLVFIFRGEPIFPSEMYEEDIQATKDQVLKSAGDLFSSACLLEPKFKELSIDDWYNVVKYTYLVQPFKCKDLEKLKSAKAHLSFAVLPFEDTICLYAQACNFLKMSREELTFYFKLADLNLYKDFNLFSAYLEREYVKGLDISKILKKGINSYGRTNQTNKLTKFATETK